MKGRLRHWLRRILLSLTALILTIWLIDQWVWRSTQQQMYADIAALPHRKVGLLLGTSKYGRHGWTNYYYAYRIQAAVALYNAGKIDYILVSGDNRHASYNEPETMQADLIKAGVPANRIVLDYAGFRTLDSIVRCRDVFGETRRDDHFPAFSQCPGALHCQSPRHECHCLQRAGRR